MKIVESAVQFFFLSPPPHWGGLDLKRDKKVPARAQLSAAERAESPQIGLPGHPPEGEAPGAWLVSFKKHSAVHGKVEKSATSMGLRAPAGRFDAAKGDDGRRAVLSSPGREPWTTGSSSGMPGDAEEGKEVEMLPLVLSLAPCGGAGCCPRPPLPWRWAAGHNRGTVGGR